LFSFERWSLVLLVKKIYILRTKFDNKTNIQPIFVIVLSVLGLKEERERVTKKNDKGERTFGWSYFGKKKKSLLMSMTSFSQEKFNGDDVFL
jgi:hypothetical protein